MTKQRRVPLAYPIALVVGVAVAVVSALAGRIIRKKR